MINAILPQEVDDMLIAFPAGIGHLMPKMEDIPLEFQKGHNKWHLFFNDYFFSGVDDLEFNRKEGIDSEMAWRHIQCIIGSYEPKHQHKEAAVAYLMSLWFDDVRWKRKKES